MQYNNTNYYNNENKDEDDTEWIDLGVWFLGLQSLWLNLFIIFLGYSAVAQND